MKKTGGNIRVIIDHISPQVDQNRYPVKRLHGEELQVKAHIYADGHDEIRAVVMYQKAGQKIWQEQPMVYEINDEWLGSFELKEKGIYKFTVKAWVDHFLTWYEGFKKKAADNQNLATELLEGAEYLKAIGKGKPKSVRDHLNKLIKIFKDPSKYEEAVDLVLEKPFSELVSNNYLVNHPTIYPVEVTLKVEDARAGFTSWYEFFPRSAAAKPGKHGTFKDCEKLLPRVAAMGFDVLYFPPIHPIGKLHRKGRNNAVKAKKGEPGSPWAIGSDEGGHKSIHPELGTLGDFKNLVKKAKALGIDIAMDIALQCAPDHPYVKAHPQWFKWRPDGTVKYAENPPKKYQDILPIDFETEDWQALWDELESIFTYWIGQGISIFRVDNPHTKPTPFWEWLIASVQEKHPDVIFLSEAFTRPKVMAGLAKAGFTHGYTYFTWRNSKAELVTYINELTQGPLRDYFRPNFWPNTPDILPYFLQDHGENAFLIRYVLAATLSSNYGLYGPVYEFYENKPVPGKEEYLDSEKYEIKHHDWNKTNRLSDIITLVNKARKENSALQSTWNLQFCDIHNDHIIAYLKTGSDRSNLILVVVNLDPNHTQSGYVQLPAELLKKKGKDIFIELSDLGTGSKYTWTQEWNYIELDPAQLPFHLFKLKVY